MKVEVRNAYEMSAGKPEGQNINVMCEDQIRYEACTVTVYRGGFSDEQPLKVGVRNRCFGNCLFTHHQSLTYTVPTGHQSYLSFLLER
jgi:hypothetical protein